MLQAIFLNALPRKASAIVLHGNPGEYVFVDFLLAHMAPAGDKEKPKVFEKKDFRLCALASLGRFERSTFRLGGGCSILLSYRDIEDLKITDNCPEIRAECHTRLL